MIKIYSIATCPYCNKVKDYFDSKNISYEYIDISKDKKGKEEMIEKSGQKSVPVIDINGEIIVGFHRNVIDKALRK